jgi:hypothetical protein
VIGSVTDYNPYYPPRCGLRVEWYSANAGFHEIPPGYGLPWGTPEEEYIPESLVFEAEMAVAKAEMASQTPNCPRPPLDPPKRSLSPEAPQLFNEVPSSDAPAEEASRENDATDGTEEGVDNPQDAAESGANDSENTGAIRTIYELAAEEELPPGSNDGDAAPPPLPPQTADGGDTTGATGAHGARVLADAPHGSTQPPPCLPYNGPVMTHTRIYSGNDGDFTEALANYYHFRNDARFGGWQNYLQRSDDFIRFCCHMHISEMLSARGGGDKTRVVWHQSDCR